MYKFVKNFKNESQHSKLYIKSKDPVGNINKAKKIIKYEYSKYPELIKRTKLKYVNLVSELEAINSPEIKKYVRVSQVPDPEADCMYIDVDYVDQEEYFRSCTNHEIWHQFECKMTGEFIPNDVDWFELNPKGFEYGKGGWVAYHSKFENKFYPSKGFITSYCTLSSDEDKAELFTYYFTDHLRPKLDEVIKSDKILQKKLKLLLERVGVSNK